MRKIFVRLACLAASLLAPSTGHADKIPCTPVELLATGSCESWWPEIPDEPLCSDYIAAWLRMAKAAKEKHCSPGGPMWATDYTKENQGDFCFSAGTDGNNARTEEMKRVMSACDACSYVAGIAVDAATDNKFWGCGLSDPTNPGAYLYGNWTRSYQDQLNACIAARTQKTKAEWVEYQQIVYAMAELVRFCKLTHTYKGCTPCHSTGSSAAVPATTKVKKPLSSSIQHIRRRDKPASKAGTNSAMDRLSGDGMQLAPSGASQSGGGSRPRPSAGGAASSTSPESGSSTTDPRTFSRTRPR
jgi:hypothetical protein